MGVRNLLVNVGFAVAKAGAKFDPSGVAANLIDRYAKQHDLGQLKGELDDLLQAQFGAYRQEVAGAMADLHLEIADEVRGQVEAYLSQFQASAKQAARIHGDASAKTVPNTVSVDDPAQLAAFLPQRPPRFTVGSAVPGRPLWTLVEPLGVGGFGEVWKAENPYFEPAAFKFFNDALARKRFTLKEAEALAQILRHGPTDGIVRLLDVGVDQDPPWLQLEFLPGGDLSGLPEKWKTVSVAERVARAHAVIRSLAATAGHFHNLRVVHRDLKPSNVLMRANGELVVADFGISKIIPAAPSTTATPANSASMTTRAYTELYAPPEQKQPNSVPHPREDVYALGVLWYQLLRGDLKLPVPTGNRWKRELAKLGVSEPVVSLLNRCWDEVPNHTSEDDPSEVCDRPADGNELVSELDAALGERRGVSTPVIGGERRGVSTPVNAPANVQNQDQNRRAYATPLAKSERKPGEEVQFPLPGGLTMAFRWIPPGTAQLGSPKTEADRSANEDEATRGVYTSKGFWLATNPVTQAEWTALMGKNPSHFQKDNAKGLDTSRFPVEQVSWDMICGTDGAAGPDTLLGKMNALGGVEKMFGAKGAFALPHEDEWEYACRGGKGNTQPFYWGTELSGTQANHDGNYPFGTTAKGPYLERPTPVGTYAAKYPHPWGLCDMHGNVWEWCENLYDRTNARVLRGGSWDDFGFYCRAAFRFRITPGDLYGYFGCRFCLRLD